MKKLLNSFFAFLKYILLILAFGASLFVILKLYLRLEKNMLDAIPIFAPYVLLFILFILNFVFNREYVRHNIFFNITCCLAFITNLVVVYRAVFDTNMLFNGIQKMGVNFNYFNDYLAFNKIMYYGLSACNVIFMLMPNTTPSKKKDKKDKKKDKKVEKIIIDDKNKESEITVTSNFKDFQDSDTVVQNEEQKVEMDDEII